MTVSDQGRSPANSPGRLSSSGTNSRLGGANALRGCVAFLRCGVPPTIVTLVRYIAATEASEVEPISRGLNVVELATVEGVHWIYHRRAGTQHEATFQLSSA